MKTRRTILFPTDFSDRANAALDVVIDFGQKFHDELIIYHVYHRPVFEGATSRTLDGLLRRLEEKVEEEFRLLEKSHSKLRKVDHEFRKDLGISVYNIADLTKKEEVDLIMMATKGAKGLGELWGTKTAKIIKSVHVPVLVIPDNSTLNDVKKIGLACDYSAETDYHQLRFLLDVAESINADIEVITLNRDERKMTRQEIENREKMKVMLEGVNTSFNFTFNDNVEEGIIDYCQSGEIGLISILPKSYNFIERLFHESLTTKMAFHSPVPLLVLK